MSFTPITLTGGPYTDAHGTALEGWVILRLTQGLTQSGGPGVLPTDIRIALDDTGAFSEVVTATNDPGNQQQAQYEVAFETGGGFNPALSIFITVPYDADDGTISINDCPWSPTAQWTGGAGGGSGGGSGGGGGGGGGGGSSNDLRIVEADFYWDTPDLVTGAVLYQPAEGDIIYDWVIQIITAWNGVRPQFDLGNLVFGADGLLVENGLPPIPLWTASAAGSSESGLLLATGTFGFAAALANAGIANGPGILDSLITVNLSAGLRGIVSQDGTAHSAVAATCLGSTVSLPLAVDGSNNQFAYVGTNPTTGGGGQSPEFFTVADSPGGGYTTIAAVVAAMAAATGSSEERFDTYAVPSASSGAIKLTAATSGAAANGNQIQASTNDVSADLGFGAPPPFTGGLGGNPGASQGQAKLYILTGTPS